MVDMTSMQAVPVRGNSTEVKLDTEPPDKAIDEPSSPAQRMRRYRRRRRYRRLSVRIEVDQAEIDALIKRRYLKAFQRGDVAAIGDAVGAFISDVLVFGVTA
jgi:hypothetical protein